MRFIITIESVNHAREMIIEHWKDDGVKVVDLCNKVKPFKGNSKDFLMNCTACGGNWGGMLLTGIRELYPEVYDAIPNDMGVFAWECLCNTLILLGVDTSK